MKEIPYNLVTPIVGDYDFFGETYLLYFQDKRKVNKRSLLNKLSSDITNKLTPEFITLKNRGFSLEISDTGVFGYNVPKLIVSHPELPERLNYKFAFNLCYDNFFKFLKLISQCGNIKNRVLTGSFVYDPQYGFFMLDNGDLDEELDLGEKLSGKWTKLIPGHEYYIELDNTYEIQHVIYLGELSNVKTPGPARREKYIYASVANISFNSYVNFVNSDVRLFKDLDPINPRPYFITTKQKIKGVDLGDTGETMNELEYEEMCTREKWILGIKDKVRVKETIIESLIDIVQSSNKVLPTRYITGSYYLKNLDLQQYNSKTLFDLLKGNTRGFDWYERMTGFARLFFNRDLFEFTDDDIKEILDEVFKSI